MEQDRYSQKQLDRRTFIGTGVAATLAMRAGSASARSEKAPIGKDSRGRPLPYNPRTFQAMPTRNLGRTGHRVGIFSLGGQAVIETSDRLQAEAVINKAIDLGVNYIDTASSYGNGQSEQHIGPVMKYRRREVYLATKTHDRSYDGSMRLLERSLERLQTDHLDCWQLHNVQTKAHTDRIFAKDGAIKALEKARDEGIVRFLGITGHYDPFILVEAINHYPFDTLLMAFNAADRHQHSFIEHLLPVALDKKMGIIGMKVATRGRMLSTWTPPPLNEQPQRMATDRPGTITMKESLFYNFSIPVSTNIVGCDNPVQVEENVRSASEFTPYNDAVMARLEERCKSIVNQGLYFRKGIIDRLDS
ncbi:MAG TPA: aldo/keto reductase [Sedimentisphaerales bacterium]|nr:aldo/keto reductase [Sedimentisphaerales bacterium]